MWGVGVAYDTTTVTSNALCTAASALTVVAALYLCVTYKAHSFALRSAFNDVFVAVVVVQLIHCVVLLAVAVTTLAQQGLDPRLCDASGSAHHFLDGMTQVLMLAFFVIVGNTRLVTSLEYLVAAEEHEREEERARGETWDYYHVVDEEPSTVGGSKRDRAAPRPRPLPPSPSRDRGRVGVASGSTSNVLGSWLSAASTGVYSSRSSVASESDATAREYREYSEHPQYASAEHGHAGAYPYDSRRADPEVWLSAEGKRRGGVLRSRGDAGPAEPELWRRLLCCAAATADSRRRDQRPVERFARFLGLESGDRVTFVRVTWKVYVVALLYASALLTVFWLTLYGMELSPTPGSSPSQYFVQSYAWCWLPTAEDVPAPPHAAVVVRDDGKRLSTSPSLSPSPSPSPSSPVTPVTPGLPSSSASATTPSSSSSSSSSHWSSEATAPYSPWSRTAITAVLTTLYVLSTYVGPLLTLGAALYAYRSLRRSSPSLVREHPVIFTHLFLFSAYPALVSLLDAMHRYSHVAGDFHWVSSPMATAPIPSLATVVSFMYPLTGFVNVCLFFYAENIAVTAGFTCRNASRLAMSSMWRAAGSCCCCGRGGGRGSTDGEVTFGEDESGGQRWRDDLEPGTLGETARAYGPLAPARTGRQGSLIAGADHAVVDETAQLYQASPHGFCDIVKAIACATVQGLPVGGGGITAPMLLDYDGQYSSASSTQGTVGTTVTAPSASVAGG